MPENRKVMDMIRAQEQKRDLHDQFQHQVGVMLPVVPSLNIQGLGSFLNCRCVWQRGWKHKG